MRLELFPFRYRDPLSSRIVVARYRTTREEIAACYAEWEIVGPAELREPDLSARRFDLGSAAVDFPPQFDPMPDADERSLALLFLRRYVTYCARRRRFAAMQGAARLAREIADR